MVHTQAVKRNGKKFVYPEPVAGLWIDKSHDSKSNTYVAKKILKARGVDPATVHVLPRSD